MTPEPSATLWRRLAELTPARIGLGRSGSGMPTSQTLSFALAHAMARDAVHAPLDIPLVRGQIEAAGFKTVTVASRAETREQYLVQPDLGRRLSAASERQLSSLNTAAVDLALILGDGLSSKAVHTHAVSFLAALQPHIARHRWSLAPVILASQARVAIADEAGALLNAKASVMVIGERPGLSSPDSLGVYITYAPRAGRQDSERNCISNIHQAGLTYEEAAFKTAWLLQEALARRLTGVALKDESGVSLAATNTPAISAS
jgi:ethanolamine ammonia-lyase small subunit